MLMLLLMLGGQSGFHTFPPFHFLIVFLLLFLLVVCSGSWGAAPLFGWFVGSPMFSKLPSVKLAANVSVQLAKI